MTRIAMTLLVKNEEDVIEANLRFHASMGVDHFVVTDNGSNDNTFNILKALQASLDITLLHEPGARAQKKRTTFMTKLAKKTYQPDWIINCDADEFWMPGTGNLKNALREETASILKVPMFNMISDDSFDHWHEANQKVVSPIHYQDQLIPNKVLGQAYGKVIIQPSGYIKTNAGNHSAEHIKFWNKRVASNISIYHYPLRSFEQFLDNVKVRVETLKSGEKMGGNVRVWAKAYDEGRVEELWEQYHLSAEEVKTMTKFGILEQDDTMKEAFAELLS